MKEVFQEHKIQDQTLPFKFNFLSNENNEQIPSKKKTNKKKKKKQNNVIDKHHHDIHENDSIEDSVDHIDNKIIQMIGKDLSIDTNCIENNIINNNDIIIKESNNIHIDNNFNLLDNVIQKNVSEVKTSNNNDTDKQKKKKPKKNNLNIITTNDNNNIKDNNKDDLDSILLEFKQLDILNQHKPTIVTTINNNNNNNNHNKIISSSSIITTNQNDHIKSQQPHFLSYKDPILTEDAKLLYKYGKGKNLVAIGPMKKRDPKWMGSNSFIKDKIVNNSNNNNNSNIAHDKSNSKTHSSAFSFSFNGL